MGPTTLPSLHLACQSALDPDHVCDSFPCLCHMLQNLDDSSVSADIVRRRHTVVRTHISSCGTCEGQNARPERKGRMQGQNARAEGMHPDGCHSISLNLIISA